MRHIRLSITSVTWAGRGVRVRDTDGMVLRTESDNGVVRKAVGSRESEGRVGWSADRRLSSPNLETRTWHFTSPSVAGSGSILLS